MGIEATLTVVPRTEMRKKKRTPDLPTFELYKDWNELDSALETMGNPLRKALRGNHATSDDEEADCDRITIPPALVKKIHEALGAVTDDLLLAAIHEQRIKSKGRLRKYEYKNTLATFQTLKAAYALAAKDNSYVEIFLG